MKRMNDNNLGPAGRFGPAPLAPRPALASRVVVIKPTHSPEADGRGADGRPPETGPDGRRADQRRLCTIVARNYLATATLLARTFRHHHPDIPVTVLIVDGDELDGAVGHPFEVVLPSDLGLDPDQLGQMATYYDVTELSTALKPTLIEALLDRGAGSVMYLDPDIEVFAPLDDLFEAAADHDIVLTPHVLAPVPRDGLLVDEEAFLRAGQFNLGFIAVGAGGRPFLRYWGERTRLFAIVDCDRGYFTDQRWVDAVPALFDHVVVRDRGCNVAYWNLHERELAVDADGRWWVDGGALRFFHYSGHDAAEPFRLSRHLLDRGRVRVEDHPPLRRLLHERAERIVAAEADVRPPYGYARAQDGTALLPWIRRTYWEGVRQADADGTEPPPHAFQPMGGDGLNTWLRTPAHPSTGVPRHLLSYWETRADLQVVFPDPLGASAEALTRWAATDTGYAEIVPVALRPTPPPASSATGVNLVGYHAGQFGVAEAGRLVARMVRAAGVPVATTTLYPPEHAHSEAARPALGGAPFDLSILSMNADALIELAGTEAFAAHADRRRIGVWYWEVGPLPEPMRPAFGLVDEVWCASEHIQASLAPHSDRPVRTHPVIIDVPSTPTALERADLDLPADRFLIGFAFDYLSVSKRKNPLGLIDAYCRAFGPDDGATLILKTQNGRSQPAQAAAVRHAAELRPDITVIDRHLPAIEMRALFQLLDCYVSLHRSEGLGLTLASAMAAGTPCIATGWSGNLTFMTPASSVLVPYDLVEVGPDAAPYLPSARWAEPDLDVAAAAMRRLFEDRSAAAALGARGRAHVIAHHGVGHAARWFADQLPSASAVSVPA